MCLMYIALNPRRLPAVAISTNYLEVQISAHETSKMSRYFVPLFFKELTNSKCTLKKFKIINFFLHNNIEWLRVLIEKINFVELGLKCSNLPPLMYQIHFAGIARSNQIYKKADFRRNYLVHNFGEG